MATFNETRAPTSGKYVADPGIADAKLIKNISNCLVALLDFCFRKTTLKSKISEFLLPLGHTFEPTFSETHQPTSRRYVAEQGIVI